METNLVKNPNYDISQGDDGALILTWQQLNEVPIAAAKAGIRDFAEHCKKHKPAKALINAVGLDPGSDAIQWISGQKQFENEEAYTVWWLRDIVPLYNDSGMKRLSVATGNPGAPGVLSNMPDDVEFAVGYFHKMENAKAWN